jgi:hypothetical protein
MKGNKGEWSELYVLLKLLSEGKVYGADKDLNRIDDIFYDIIRIIRRQTDSVFEYERNINITIINQSTNEIIITVPLKEFRINSKILLDEILKIKTRDGSFEIPRLSDFVDKIQVSSLKAKSSDKADLLIKMHDYITGSDPTLGFSIKSRLGSASTLLNAGGTTNFVYKLFGNVNYEVMTRFNEVFKIRGSKIIPDLRKRFEILAKNNVDISYVDMVNKTFKNNLILIDSLMPEICALLLKEFYVTGLGTCKQVLQRITDENPMAYDLENGQPFYEYKFKRLVSESALGMLPGTTWNGFADATGGYLIVREDGEVLCYHLYNRNAFEDYLLENTRFETPSTSKYDFGYIYREGENYFLKLNMQIRFIK